MTNKKIAAICLALAWSGTASAEYWVVTKGRPYAAWSARSDALTGSVVYVKDGEAIDKAYLMPEQTVQTDQDLMEGRDVILPKGSILLKMRGNLENLYCTLKHGDNAKDYDFSKKIQISYEKGNYLCISADQNMVAGNPVVMQGFYPALYTIFRMGSGLFGQKIGQTNLIHLSEFDRMRFDKIAQIRVIVKTEMKKNKIRESCLQGFIDRGFSGNNDIYTDKFCFSSGVTVINVAGGVYRLKSADSSDQLTIEIEKAIDQPYLTPIVVE